MGSPVCLLSRCVKSACQHLKCFCWSRRDEYVDERKKKFSEIGKIERAVVFGAWAAGLATARLAAHCAEPAAWVTAGARLDLLRSTPRCTEWAWKLVFSGMRQGTDCNSETITQGSLTEEGDISIPLCCSSNWGKSRLIFFPITETSGYPTLWREGRTVIFPPLLRCN